MSFRIASSAALALILVGPAASTTFAQAPAPVVIYQAAPGVCAQCGKVHAPGAGRGERSWFRNQGTPDANPYLGPNRLPRGQVYYNGRYFGSFNNRFYGPQYGYF